MAVSQTYRCSNIWGGCSRNERCHSIGRSSCSHFNIKCSGVYRGYRAYEGDIRPLDARSVNNIINKGGTKLKSARSLDFHDKEGRLKASENLKNLGIDALIVIGGDGSFTGGMIFEREHKIPVIGIPGTIDNDIFGTSHTIGYDTALNTVVEAIDKIRDTAISHNRLFFVEVMGRDAGHIALNVGIGAGAEEILIPRRTLVLIDFWNLCGEVKNQESHLYCVVAEGDKIGKNVFELHNTSKKICIDEVRVSVLGHIQRGGTPSCFDRTG